MLSEELSVEELLLPWGHSCQICWKQVHPPICRVLQQHWATIDSCHYPAQLVTIQLTKAKIETKKEKPVQELKDQSC